MRVAVPLEIGLFKVQGSAAEGRGLPIVGVRQVVTMFSRLGDDLPGAGKARFGQVLWQVAGRDLRLESDRADRFPAAVDFVGFTGVLRQRELSRRGRVPAAEFAAAERRPVARRFELRPLAALGSAARNSAGYSCRVPTALRIRIRGKRQRQRHVALGQSHVGVRSGRIGRVMGSDDADVGLARQNRACRRLLDGRCRQPGPRHSAKRAERSPRRQ